MNSLIQTISFRTICLVFGATALAVSVTASSPAAAYGDSAPGESASHGAHAGLFAGMTIASGESAFTVGADYEYRLSQDYGIVGLVDLAFFDELVAIYGIGLMVHVMEPLRFLAAPGFEIADGEFAFAVRAGLAYDFHLDSLTISPTANFDLVHGHISEVVGLTFGMEL